MEHKHRKSHRNETSALRRFLLAVGLLALAASLSMMDFPDEATAQEQTVPYRINFQGRLSDNDGRIKPNGDYNVRFRLYDSSAGGSALWEEERTSGDRIELRDGLFHLQLGSVQPLPPGIFATYPVYLEVELPSPESATSSSPDWSEGPFTPRQRIASAPYAFNSDQLDGMDASEFVHLAPSETQEGSIDIDGAGQFGGSLQADGTLTVDGTGSSSIAGDLGIGTSSPQATLDVDGSGVFSGTVSGQAAQAGDQFTTRDQLDDIDVSDTAFLHGGNAFGEPAEIGTTDDAALALLTDGYERMRITSQGDLGIGTTSPDARLHVDGDGILEGDLTVTAPEYEIGDEGPAGGLVFFVDEQDEHDFEYLEAAPEGWDGNIDDPTPQWGCRGQSVPGASGTAIGDGADNTQAIVGFHDDSSNFNGEDYYTYSGDYSNIGCNDNNNGEVAAQVAAEADIGGYSDWFLPSEDELNEMYGNLRLEGLGGFETGGSYWSSSEVSADDARSQAFWAGNKNTAPKTNTYFLRPVRDFTGASDFHGVMG